MGYPHGGGGGGATLNDDKGLTVVKSILDAPILDLGGCEVGSEHPSAATCGLT